MTAGRLRGVAGGVDDLAVSLADQDWMDEGVCVTEEIDHTVFFPGVGDNLGAERARMHCRRCPVRVECLNWAMQWGISSGVYGGLAPEERSRLHRAS